jgi:hypothetical protein
MPRPQITKAHPYTFMSGRFKGRTFTSEREYRNALARAAGYASEHKRQRASKRGVAPASNHLASKQARGRALEAVALMRREGLTLKQAARRAHTTQNTVIGLGRRAVRKGQDGRWRATRADSLPRRMDMLTPAGKRTVSPRNSREASLIGEHASLMGALAAGDLAAGARIGAFKGREIDGFEFETDLDVILEQARRGELSAESIYEQPTH